MRPSERDCSASMHITSAIIQSKKDSKFSRKSCLLKTSSLPSSCSVCYTDMRILSPFSFRERINFTKGRDKVFTSWAVESKELHNRTKYGWHINNMKKKRFVFFDCSRDTSSWQRAFELPIGGFEEMAVVHATCRARPSFTLSTYKRIRKMNGMHTTRPSYLEHEKKSITHNPHFNRFVVVHPHRTSLSAPSSASQRKAWWISNGEEQTISF